MITIRILAFKEIEVSLMVALSLAELKHYKIKTKQGREVKAETSSVLMQIESSLNASLVVVLTKGTEGVAKAKEALALDVFQDEFNDFIVIDCEKELTQISAEAMAEWIKKKIIALENRDCSVWEEF